MIRLSLTGPEGVRWVPSRHVGDGVLVLAGSSGRIDSGRAQLFGEHGCIAESIRWFGGPGQNAGPWEIPIELFLDRIEDLKRDCDRVYVVGSSFGAEAALLAAVHSRSVAGVVAFAPTDVVWAGDDNGRATSHWTYSGRPLAFVPLDWAGHDPNQHPPRLRPLYESSRVRFADRVVDATIAVERIAEVILVAGGDDQVWPSCEQAARIADRRSAHGLHTTIVSTPYAGHRTILPGEGVISNGALMQRGGNEAADRQLGREAWRAVTALLGSAR